MADKANLQLESALSTLLSITEKSGNLRKELKRDIVDSVSTLRNIFVNMKNSAGEKMAKISVLESEVKKAKAELHERRVVNLSAREPPYRGGSGITPAAGVKQVLPSSGAKKLYSEVTSESIEKRYKIMVISKSDQPPETIKSILKSQINPTEKKVGIKSLKSLRDGRVLIEVGSVDETNLLSAKINAKCGEVLEANVPKFRKPRMIIRNIPQDRSVENFEETLLAQNPELSMKPGDVATRFKFKTKGGELNMVFEVGSETRKKLLQTKLKMGWLICSVGVAKRYFKCIKYSNRYQECKGEETCPLCAGGHLLKDGKTPSNQHKCTNSMSYNGYSKKGKVCENHSSLSKDCRSLQAVLTKYIENTDY